jgi:hypothetical protein
MERRKVAMNSDNVLFIVFAELFETDPTRKKADADLRGTNSRTDSELPSRTGFSPI